MIRTVYRADRVYAGTATALAPDLIVGCTGGGSNFAGLTFPFIREKRAGKEIRVLAAEPHPDADRLRVCTVDTGDGERTIVCGAPNVAAGQTVLGKAQVRVGVLAADSLRLVTIRNSVSARAGISYRIRLKLPGRLESRL